MRLCKVCNKPAQHQKTKGALLCRPHSLEYNRKYYAEHSNTITSQARKRRQKYSACKKQALSFNHRYGGNISEQELENILLKQLRNCAICKEQLQPGWHIDHIVSVALGGPSSLSNIQILCPMCNVGKYKFSQDQYIAHCRKVIEAQDKLSSEIYNG